MRQLFAEVRQSTAGCTRVRNSYTHKLVTYFVYVNPRGGRYPPCARADSLVCILINRTGIFAVGFCATEYGGAAALEAQFVETARTI